MGKADQSKEQAQSKSQHRAERFCGGRTCPNICRGEQRSPVFRICHNFRIVGERRNFCFAEIRRPDPLARLCTSA